MKSSEISTLNESEKFYSNNDATVTFICLPT